MAEKKKRMFISCLSAAFLALFLSAAAEPVQAAPLQLALWNPVQLVNEETDIQGLRINLLYGHNRDVYGVDLGVVNSVERDCCGVQIGAGLNDAGFFNDTDTPGRLNGVQLGPLINSAGEAAGLQAGILANLVRGDMQGVQLSWLVNVVMDDSCGLQAGLANVTGNNATGAQVALGIIAALNVAKQVHGAQVSAGILALNKADSVSGLQLTVGLLGNYAGDVDGIQIAATCNLARRVRGLQLGLVNYCRSLSGMQVGLVNIVSGSGLPACPLISARW